MRAEALAVDPVDTTGAGDNLAAGLLCGLGRGMGLADALRLGVACGSLSTARARGRRRATGPRRGAGARRACGGGASVSGPRISFVGAGSVEFTRDAARRHPRLPRAARGARSSLHDIDAERLADRRGRRPGDRRAARGRSPTSSRHLDRRAALDGADYVINMIQVGGHAATVTDFEIPARYGLRQTIADTLGIGGIFRGAAHLPGAGRHRRRHGRGLPGRLAAQLHQPDGDALLGDLRGHAAAAGRRPVPLGLLDASAGAGRAASACRSTRSPSSAPGVNHQAWVLRFERDGENLYPLLDERSRATRSCGGGSGSTCTGGSATSRPRRASTRPSTCPGCMRDDEEIERLRIRGRRLRLRISEENLRRVRAHPRAAGRRAPARARAAATSTRRRSSTPSRPGPPRVIYGNVRNDGPDHQPAGRRLRRGALPGRRRRRAADLGRRAAAAAGRAQPDLPQRRRADRARGARGPARSTSATRRCSTRTPRRPSRSSAIWELCDELTAAHGDALPEALRAPVAAK